MNDSKQLVIMKRLTALIEQVTPANGYDFDLANRVYRGKATFGADEPMPFVSILESLRPDERPREAGNERIKREEQWELLVQGWATENRDFPTDDLYRLKACVESRLARVIAMDGEGNPLYPDDFRLGRIITAMRIGPGIVRAATAQVGGAEAFYLPVLIGYATNLADPFSLT